MGILRRQNDTKGHFGTFVQYCHSQDTQRYRAQKLSSYAKKLQVLPPYCMKFVTVYQEIASGEARAMPCSFVLGAFLIHQFNALMHHPVMDKCLKH